MKTFSSIYHYPGLPSCELTTANIEGMMATLAEAGVTHVQVNHVPDGIHPEQLAQPENVYLAFASFGPPLDLFVSSRINRGLWPEMYLERNQACLRQFAAAARKHGIKPILYLCEPRFVPERFFQKNPTLRGSRVDNPMCSTTPLFALCTDMPEVREHYREMMRAVLEIVPDIAAVALFTSDSGAGFDYNPHSYAGSNGAGFNRGIPLEERVSAYLALLLEEGRAKSPDFEVHLTSGFDPEMRAKILARSPQGCVGSVNGLYDWEGGLEEMWGYHQSLWAPGGPKWNIRNLDRAAAYAERLDDMRQRLASSTTRGEEPLAHAQLPTTDYPRPLRYTPQPFEVVKIMKAYADLGIKRLTAWGVINPKDLVPHDINAAVFRVMNGNIYAEAHEVIRGIALDWVGETHADALVRAWKECDFAHSRRPNWVWSITKMQLLGPLVPDLHALQPEELVYYKTIALEQLERIQGVGAFIPFEADERNRDFVLDEIYDKETLPGLERAVTRLEEAAGTAAADIAAILTRQAEHIRLAWIFQRMLRSWYEAGQHLMPGAGAKPRRAFAEIVDEEIANTRAMIALVDGRVPQFLRAYPSNSLTYDFGFGFAGQLRKRIEVMVRHRNDPPCPLTDRLEKMKLHMAAIEKQIG